MAWVEGKAIGHARILNYCRLVEPGCRLNRESADCCRDGYIAGPSCWCVMAGASAHVDQDMMVLGLCR
jgi:hypothetical protein